MSGRTPKCFLEKLLDLDLAGNEQAPTVVAEQYFIGETLQHARDVRCID